MLKKMSAVWLAIVLCVLFIPGTAVADPGSQVWYLDQDNHSIPKTKIMTKSSFDDIPGNYVTIVHGESMIWLADEAAMANVTFPGGGWPGGVWIAHFLTDISGSGLTFQDIGISVGLYDSTFHDWSFEECTMWTWHGNVLHIELQRDPVTIKKGDYLALRIENKCVNAGVKIYTDGRSFLRSPCNDPGYPLPELSTLILIGSGLLGLGIYATLKRRNRVSMG
ncbi:hypothetical protein ACFLX5_05055 [Chloroflexota bacterium]